MSRAAIGCPCPVLWSLAGCIKSRERLWLQEPRAAGVRTSDQQGRPQTPWQTPRRARSDLPPGMIATRLPRVNRFKEIWKVSQRRHVGFVGGDVSRGGKTTEESNLLLETGCRTLGRLRGRPWGPAVRLGTWPQVRTLL